MLEQRNCSFINSDLKTMNTNRFKTILLSAFFLLGMGALISATKQTNFNSINELVTRICTGTTPALTEKVYVQLDRTFYKPGEDVWFKAYLRDANTLMPSKKSGILHVELHNPQGGKIKHLKLIANTGGAAGDFHISEDLPGGIYKIKAYSNWQKNFKQVFEREITVQKSVLPNLRMKLDFERETYGPGDKVVAELDLNTLDNKTLGNYQFRYLVMLDGKEIGQYSGKTNPEGHADLNFKLPKDLATNDGMLNILISYRGQTESISRSVPIVLGNIDLQFFPEGGDLIAEMPSRLAFKAINEFGKPADIVGVIYKGNDEEVARFSSFHQGMGGVEFTPEAGVAYYAKLSQPSGLKEAFQIPNVRKDGYGLKVIQQTNDRLDVSVFSSQKEELLLVAKSHGQEYFSKKIKTKGGQQISILTDDFPIGVSQITLLDSKEIPRAERLVFINTDKQLNIEVFTDKEEYQPREKVQMSIKATDEQGRPVAGDFSLAVADDKLLTFADDKQGNILAHTLLESELTGEIFEPNFYFDTREEKAGQALDYLLLTQGWRRFTWEQIAQNKRFPHVAERGVISGEVVDSYLEPVAGIEVKLRDTKHSATTDKNGRFIFSDAKLYKTSQLDIEHEKYEKFSFSIANYMENMRFQLQLPPGTMSGTITDKDTREPIHGAYVYIQKEGRTIATAGTDVDGKYSFPRLYPGFYDMLVIRAGDRKELKKVKVFSNTNVRVNTDIKQESTQLNEVVVTGYKVPLIRQDAAVSLSTVSSEEIRSVNRKKRTKKYKQKAENKRMSEVVVTDDIMVEPPQEVTQASLPEPEPELAQAFLSEIEEEIEFEDQTVEEETTLEMPPPPPPPALKLPPPPPPPPPVLEEDVESDEIFTIVQDMPQFPGCEGITDKMERKKCAEKLMLRHIYSNLKYPAIARESAIEGMAVVNFTIEKDGSIANAKVLRDPGGGLGKEAIRMVESMPKWTPGQQRNQPVAVSYNLPIRFKLDGSSAPAVGLPSVGQPVAAPSVPTQYYRAREFYAPKYETKEQNTLRSDFRSTVYWNPNIQTNSRGEAKVEFYNADNLTTFRATLEGFSNTGGIGRQEARYFTQLPFQMMAKVPAEVLTGDKVSVPLTLTNNTDQNMTGNLRLAVPANFKMIKEINPTISLRPKQSKTVLLEYLVEDVLTMGEFRIHFETDGAEDTFTESIKTTARGFPVHEVFAGNKLENKFDVNIDQSLQGSVQATLTAYPNVMSEVMRGMEKMLRQPGGCFEQTSSSNYPNVLVLNYLQETGESNNKIQKQANQYLKAGYNRLKGFEVEGGGFDWYGRSPAHEGLTAYGILQFTDMQKVYQVEQDLIDRAAKWLMKRRDGQGSWMRAKRGSFAGRAGSNSIGDAYIVWALAEADYGNSIKAEINKSYKDAMSGKDPYVMALVANALYATKDARAKNVMDKLLALQNENGSWTGLVSSVTGSQGIGLQVETTALTALAILKEQYGIGKLSSAMKFIAGSKNHYGFGSTQSTILALKAMTEHAKYSKQTKSGGTLVIFVNGEKVGTASYTANQKEEVVLENLENHLTAGTQKVEVRYEGTRDALPFDLELNYATRKPQDAAECQLEISTSLSSKEARMGETVRLTSTISNKHSTDSPNAIALIGIPAGLSPQPWQLKELTEQGKADFYELWNGYVVLHYRSLPQGENRIIHLDLKADIPGEYEAPASSAYLYYTNEFKNWAQPERIVIRS